MGIVNDIFDSLRFKDTIFYKSNSDLQERFNELKKLNILTPVKIKTHGESIINEINKN